MEHQAGIEPASLDYKTRALPLSYWCIEIIDMYSQITFNQLVLLVRVMGLEPISLVYETSMLPLQHSAKWQGRLELN